MALRVALTKEEHYRRFQELIRSIKRELIGEQGNSGWYVLLQNGNRNWAEFVRVQSALTNALAKMDETAAIPGIVDIIREIEGDPTYDVVAEYTAMKNAVVAIRDWIFNNMPKVNQAGTLYLAVQTLAQNGTTTDREFTPAQTAPLRALIDTFRSTVD